MTRYWDIQKIPEIATLPARARNYIVPEYRKELHASSGWLGGLTITLTSIVVCWVILWQKVWPLSTSLQYAGIGTVAAIALFCLWGYSRSLGQSRPAIQAFIDEREDELASLDLVQSEPEVSPPARAGFWVTILLLTLATGLILSAIFGEFVLLFAVFYPVYIAAKIGSFYACRRAGLPRRWFEVDIEGVQRIELDFASHRNCRILLNGECVYEYSWWESSGDLHAVKLDVEGREMHIEWSLHPGGDVPPTGRVFIDDELFIAELFPVD
jgi:hypothetical protein